MGKFLRFLYYSLVPIATAIIVSIITGMFGLSDYNISNIPHAILSFTVILVLFFCIVYAFSIVALVGDAAVNCNELRVEETVKIGAKNALGGAISASVGYVVWEILEMVLMFVPIVGLVFMLVPATLIAVILYLIFGLALARNVAMQQLGCTG